MPVDSQTRIAGDAVLAQDVGLMAFALRLAIEHLTQGAASCSQASERASPAALAHTLPLLTALDAVNGRGIFQDGDAVEPQCSWSGNSNSNSSSGGGGPSLMLPAASVSVLGAAGQPTLTLPLACADADAVAGDLPAPARAVTPLKAIRVGLLLPTATHHPDDANEFQRAADVAAEYFSRLVDFSLTVSVVHVEGDCANATTALLSADVHVVVGAVRSNCSILAARRFGDAGVPMLSMSSTAAVLSNTTRFPTFFRIPPSDMYQSRALAALVARFQWSRVGIIATANPYASALAADFATSVRAQHINVTTLATVADAQNVSHVRRGLLHLRLAGAAVNLISALPEEAAVILREAVAAGMAGADWVWLGTDGSLPSVGVAADPGLAPAQVGMLGLHPVLGAGPRYDTWLRYTSPSGLGEAMRGAFTLQLGPKSFAPNLYVAHTFDCIEAIARGTHQQVVAAQQQAPAMPWGTKEARAAILQGLRALDHPERGFDGAIGTRVSFDSAGNGPILYDIRNVQRSVGAVRVGSFTPAGGLGLTQPVLFGDGRNTTPSDTAVFRQSLKVGVAVPAVAAAMYVELDAVSQAAARLAASAFSRLFAVEIELYPHYGAPVNDTAACAAAGAFFRAANVHAVIHGFTATCGRAIMQGLLHPVPMLQLPAPETPFVAPSTPFSSPGALLPLANATAGAFSLGADPAYVGAALGSMVARFGWTAVSLLGPECTATRQTLHALRNTLQQANATSAVARAALMAQTEPLDPAHAAAAVRSLKRGNTAVNVLVGPWSSADALHLAMESLVDAGMIGPEWTWLIGPGVLPHLSTASRAMLRGALVLAPLRQTTSAAYSSLVTYEDPASVCGERLRNSFSLLLPTATSRSPSTTALYLHDGVFLLGDALQRAASSAAVQFGSTTADIGAALRSQLQTASVEGAPAIVTPSLWPNAAGYVGNAFAILNVRGAASVADVGVLSGRAPAPKLSADVLWPSGGTETPATRPFVRRALRIAMILPLSRGLASSRLQLQLQAAIAPMTDYAQENMTHTIVETAVVDAALPCDALAEDVGASEAHAVVFAGTPACARLLSAHFPSLPILLASDAAGQAYGNASLPANVLSLAPAPRMEALAMAEIAATSFGWRRMAVFVVGAGASSDGSVFATPASAYGDVARAFQAAFTALGGSVSALVSVTMEDMNPTALHKAMAELRRGGSAVTLVIGANGEQAPGCIAQISAAARAAGLTGPGRTWLALAPLLRGLEADIATRTDVDILRGMVALGAATSTENDAFTQFVMARPVQYRSLLAALFQPPYLSPLTPTAAAAAAVAPALDESTRRLARAVLALSATHDSAVREGLVSFAEGVEDVGRALVAGLQPRARPSRSARPARADASGGDVLRASLGYDVLNRYAGLFQRIGRYTPASGVAFEAAPVWASGSTALPADAWTSLSTDGRSDDGAAVGMGLGVALAALAVLCLVAVYLRRRSRRDARLSPHNFNDELKAICGELAPAELARGSLTLLDEIGSGQFGAVFKATIQHNNLPEYTVAVKTLKEDSGSQHRADFLREAALMAQFHHPNILQLVGVCTRSQPMLLAVQYCENGSLYHFLQSRAGFLDISLTSKLFIARDICEGMLALANRGIVHRDLSARNVLLDAQFSCKVADFGRSG